jgi:hypothetical protein
MYDIHVYIYICAYMYRLSRFLKKYAYPLRLEKNYLLSSVHYMSTTYYFVLIPGAICIYLNKPFLILKPELRKYSYILILF